MSWSRPIPGGTIIGASGVSEMIIHVSGVSLRRAQPGTRVDEESIVEDQEMRITHIALGNTEFEDGLPPADAVITGQDVDLRCGKDHVTFRAASMGQKKLPLELHQIGEGIVETVIHDSVNGVDVDLGQIGHFSS